MKKQVQHIIIILAAIAVFFTGTGVTVMNYCCSGCMYEFLTLETKSCCLPASEAKDMAGSEHSTCCSDHSEHDNTVSHFDCADKLVSDGKHCSASRMSIDIASSMFKPSTTAPFIWLSDAAVLTHNVASHTIGYVENVDFADSPPSIMSPRAYLSLIRVLLI